MFQLQFYRMDPKKESSLLNLNVIMIDIEYWLHVLFKVIFRSRSFVDFHAGSSCQVQKMNLQWRWLLHCFRMIFIYSPCERWSEVLKTPWSLTCSCHTFPKASGPKHKSFEGKLALQLPFSLVFRCYMRFRQGRSFSRKDISKRLCGTEITRSSFDFASYPVILYIYISYNQLIIYTHIYPFFITWKQINIRSSQNR